MPKRFTDTEKWKDDWFGVLNHQMKLVWLYLCDQCDHAGIYKPNLRTMQFDLDMNVSVSEILDGLNNGKERVQVLKNGRWYIKDFIPFQYGNGKSRAYFSAVTLLKQNGLEFKGMDTLSIELGKGTVTHKAKASAKAKAKGGSRGGESKEAFGEFKTVFLSKEEYQKLLGKFGPHGTEDWIDQLDRWQKKEAKQNASAYATILSWENKRRKEQEAKGEKGRFNWVKS